MGEDGGGEAPCNELAEFYRLGYRRLVGFVIALGTSPHDAHIAQTAVVELVEQWSRIRDPYAWVHKVAYRQYRIRLGGDAAVG